MDIRKTLNCLLGGVEDKQLLAEVMIHLFGNLEPGPKVRRILGEEDEVGEEDGQRRPLLRTHRNARDVVAIVGALVVARSDVGRYTAEEIEAISNQQGLTETVEFLRGSTLGLIKGISMWGSEKTGPDHSLREQAVIKTLWTLLFCDTRVCGAWSKSDSGMLSNEIALIVEKNPVFARLFLDYTLTKTERWSDEETDPGLYIVEEFSWKLWRRLHSSERARVMRDFLEKKASA